MTPRVWFTPTSKSGYLAQAGDLIETAYTRVVCPVLNPGNAGLLGPVLEKTEALGFERFVVDAPNL